MKKDSCLLEPDEKVIREFNDRGLIWFLESNANLRDLMKMLATEIAEKLDFSRAVRLNRSFIPQNLYKQEADMLYSVPFLEQEGEVIVYLLLEHQSAPDSMMGFRFLSYLVEIWKEQIRLWQDMPTPRKTLELNSVVPILLYTGEDAWTRPVSVGTLMNLPHLLEPFVPKFDLILLNLRDLQTEELLETKTAISSIFHALKFANAPIEVLENVIRQTVANLERLPEQQQEWRRAMHFILLLIRYKRRPEERAGLFEQVTESVTVRQRKEVSDMFQTDAQFLEEKGRMEGRVEGRVEGMRRSFLKQLRHKFSPLPNSVEGKVGVMPEEELDILTVKMLDSASLQELGL